MLPLRPLKKYLMHIKTSPISVVGDVKKQVEALMSIPVSEQKLLFKGKALQDEKLLTDYAVDDGCKLTLVVKKASAVKKTNSSSITESSPVIAKTEDRPVWQKLLTFLRRHFCERDAQVVLAEFKKDFEQNLSNLSLDDIERLAITKLRQA